MDENASLDKYVKLLLYCMEAHKATIKQKYIICNMKGKFLFFWLVDATKYKENTDSLECIYYKIP